MAFYTKNTLNSVGTGIAFPLVIDSNGRTPVISGSALISSSLRLIISWVIGERFFLGEFGTGLQNLLEESNDTNLELLLAHVLPEAIGKWEPRIQIGKFDIIREGTSLSLSITYSIINTNQSYIFIYPLYTPNNF